MRPYHNYFIIIVRPSFEVLAHGLLRHGRRNDDPAERPLRVRDTKMNHGMTAFTPIPKLRPVSVPSRTSQDIFAPEDDGRRLGKPKILLATTGHLASTARLAIELNDAGASVSFIAPKTHPGRVLGFLACRYVYRSMSSRTCLERAIRDAYPDLIIPCDERTVRDMQAIARTTGDDRIKQIIERSMCPEGNFGILTSRAQLISLAEQCGVTVPRSAGLPDLAALSAWTANELAPFVLKSDGSWAGFGVRIVSDLDAASGIYKRVARRMPLRLAIRESLLEGDHFGLRTWWRRERPSVSAQSYINGWPANIGVACWQGEVLATSCVQAVSTASPTGPSTVARIIENAEMVTAATRLVEALGLSGMVGFDFMIERASGKAYLIEMNPRNTPICAVRLGGNRDLPEALAARIAGRPVRQRPVRADRDVIAFFPDAWREDPANHLLYHGYHDVPWDEPELIRRLMEPERRDRYRIYRWLRRLVTSYRNRQAEQADKQLA